MVNLYHYVLIHTNYNTLMHISFVPHTCTGINRRSKSKEEAAKEKKSAKTKAANKKSKVSKKDHIDYTDDGVINIQFIPDP